MSNIKLYSNGCPKCKVIKSKLENKNIVFEETDDTQRIILEGYKTFPVLEADGQFMDFVSANNWVNQYTEPSLESSLESSTEALSEEGEQL